MDIDISKFHQVFFDDSLENINKVEQLLVSNDASQINNEIIDAVFRCVHSIKGSSGMFGFTAITQFTHVLESYLEKARTSLDSPKQEIIELLLKSLDCLRGMIDDLQHNKKTDLTLKNELEEKFTLLEQEENATEPVHKEEVKADSTTSIEHSNLGWNIYFKPNLKIFQHGDDPLRILRALTELGKMSCSVNLKQFLDMDNFYPDECYLAWDIKLETNKSEQEIRQYAFEWVEDKSEINFSPIAIEDHEKISLHHLSDSPENTLKNKELASIRVSIEKVDELINMVGELVVTQSRLTAISNQFDDSLIENFKENLLHLEQSCRKLQENIMRIRMLPISNIFNRFPRMVHDLSKASGKLIILKISGENTELDKTILEKIIDPLVHLVRNAIDHGIEEPVQRKKSGKDELGTLQLHSYHQGSNIIIEVSDDGKGLNYPKIAEKAKQLGLLDQESVPSLEELNQLIFEPGFSTAEKVTDISGRGIGMDIVHKNIKALGGSISVQSKEGQGTTFTVCLPLTLAIIDGQLIRVGDSIYIIPLISMIETIQIKKENVNALNKTLVYSLRGKYVPIIRLHQLFNIPVANTKVENHFLVIVELNQQLFGIMIDELLQLQQVVIKSIDNCYGHIEGISGAAILGDHTVAFILDVAGIIRLTCEGLPKNSLDVMKSVA